MYRTRHQGIETSSSLTPLGCPLSGRLSVVARNLGVAKVSILIIRLSSSLPSLAHDSQQSLRQALAASAVLTTVVVPLTAGGVAGLGYSRLVLIVVRRVPLRGRPVIVARHSRVLGLVPGARLCSGPRAKYAAQDGTAGCTARRRAPALLGRHLDGADVCISGADAPAYSPAGKLLRGRGRPFSTLGVGVAQLVAASYGVAPNARAREALVLLGLGAVPARLLLADLGIAPGLVIDAGAEEGYSCADRDGGGTLLACAKDLLHDVEDVRL